MTQRKSLKKTYHYTRSMSNDWRFRFYNWLVYRLLWLHSRGEN